MSVSLSDIGIKRAVKACVTSGSIVTTPLLSHLSSWFKILRSVIWQTRFIQYNTIMHRGLNDMSVNVGQINLAELQLAF